MPRKYKILKNYRECHITSCHNRIYTGGYVCTTHRYRFKKYKSYDLPTHIGEPSTLNVEKPPEWAAGKCQIHGYLRDNQMYRSHTKGKYKTKGCRRCVLDRNIKKNYGLKGGIDEYERLAKDQNHRCSICKQQNISVTNDRSQKRKLSIDHCHKTGKFRGIICTHCNSGLGYFRDNIDFLQSAIEYLKNNESSSST